MAWLYVCMLRTTIKMLKMQLKVSGHSSEVENWTSEPRVLTLNPGGSTIFSQTSMNLDLKFEDALDQWFATFLSLATFDIVFKSFCPAQGPCHSSTHIQKHPYSPGRALFQILDLIAKEAGKIKN